eukprot:m.10172 g.10172  ORF g.10172 m.10172 type:complete len:175 (+) comp5530_c1_seq1:3-527(+)
MVFYRMTMKHDVLLSPKHFGPALQQHIKQKLFDDVESKCIGTHGFIVAVLDIVHMSEGQILATRGDALFEVTYTAIVFRPAAKQVIDAIVKNIQEEGIFLSIGPMLAIVTADNMQAAMKWDADAQPPTFVDETSGKHVVQGDKLRVRLLGVNIQASAMAASASLASDYLGDADG